jgi:hypothetical protein
MLRVMADIGTPGGPELNPNDYTNGDHSFKNWFKIMWGNHYIQIFVIGLAGLIYQLTHLCWCQGILADAINDGWPAVVLVSMGMLIPIALAGLIAYKGFYQFWNDLKNGTSR